MASLIDLFEFLDSPNPSARHLALQNLIGHTAKNDPQRHIFIPSSLAGSGGGGLLPEKRKQGSEEDQVKIKALKDLCALCQDQAVRGHPIAKGEIAEVSTSHMMPYRRLSTCPTTWPSRNTLSTMSLSYGSYHTPPYVCHRQKERMLSYRARRRLFHP